jgi:hypothetical protein
VKFAQYLKFLLTSRTAHVSMSSSFSAHREESARNKFTQAEVEMERSLFDIQHTKTEKKSSSRS